MCKEGWRPRRVGPALVTHRACDRQEHFAPYAENSRRPTFSKQVHVSSATLSVTADKVKLSFMIPRHLTKPLMLMYIQSEIDEVKRRLGEDLYDCIAVKHEEGVAPL